MRLFSLLILFLFSNVLTFSQTRNDVWAEAEQFSNLGGWDVDQQSFETIGSSYLLAHGLGTPVSDAVTTLHFPVKGKYRLWVRTYNWVARWNAKGEPGKFQIKLNNRVVPEIFGTKNSDWAWQDGGVVEVNKQTVVTLHDLTGFEGRCDALYFTKDLNFQPSNNVNEIKKIRASLLKPKDTKISEHYDLAVIGGGYAGICSAISAARNGLKVVLVQDRPVLGGNSSSEVRVWPEGKTRVAPYSRLGEIVDEISPDKAIPRFGSRNALTGDVYNDRRKLDAVLKEPNITLLLNERLVGAVCVNAEIKSVRIQHVRTLQLSTITASFYADCTGDGTLGYYSGADSEVSEQNNMGMSNLWYVLNTHNPSEMAKCERKDSSTLKLSLSKDPASIQVFPRVPWAIDLSDKPFPGRKNFRGQWGGNDALSNLGNWFWESGFNNDPIHDVEEVRDVNFRAMYGAWDALKNVDKLYPEYQIGWAAYIAGKRESRRLLGDVILSAEDFKNKTQFRDAAFPCSWHIDIHRADSTFSKGLKKGEEFISRATAGKEYNYGGMYWAPYRILYSRNIKNLFMAGRDVSVTKEGLGPVRVMRTCGLMGEIVGKAATICVKRKVTPRGVYEKYWSELQSMMR